MDFPRRFGQGLKLYVFLLGSGLLIAGVWWANGALLDNAAAGTGWAVLVGIVVVAVVTVWIGRRIAGSEGDRYDDNEEPYDWRS